MSPTRHPLALPSSLFKDALAEPKIDNLNHNFPRKPAWDSLNWQAKLKEKAWWLVCFLTLQSKFESLVYSLSIGLITAAALIFILSYLSPLALVIITGFTISILTSWLLWSFNKNSTIKQKALFLLMALSMGALFFIIINFAAIPTLGIGISLSGGGFMAAAANAAIYLTIFLGLVQLILSSIKHWQATHQLNSESSLQIAHNALSTTSLTTERLKAPYTSLQRFYLIYKGVVALGLSIAIGALSYYSFLNLVPVALLSLGVSLSSSILMPIGISLFVITSLIISKQLFAQVVKQVEEMKMAYPSLLEELLNPYQNIRFAQEPSIKTRLVITALWRAIFSYKAYQSYSSKYQPLYLTQTEFRIRNGILILFFPITLTVLALKPFLSKEYKRSLNHNLEGQFFWKKPLPFCFKFLIFHWKYFFSYATYRKAHQTNSIILTRKQFYLRNSISIILLPLLIVGSILSLYASSVGMAQLTGVVKLSENLALGLSGLVDAFFVNISSLVLINKASGIKTDLAPKISLVTTAKLGASYLSPTHNHTSTSANIDRIIQTTHYRRRFTPPALARDWPKESRVESQALHSSTIPLGTIQKT